MADQPPGPSFPLEDVIATAKSVWQAFVGPAFLGAWGLYRFIVTRKDTREDRDLKERENFRASVGAREIAYMDRVEKESARKDADIQRERERNTALEAHRDEAERQRDEALRNLEIERERGYGWKWRSHSLKHDLGGTRGTINAQRAGVGKDEVDWLDEALPAYEDILADNVEYTQRKRDWIAAQNAARRSD